MKKIYSRILAAGLFAIGMQAAAQSPVTFNYTGSLQTFTVPSCVTSITIETYGAQGGTASYGPPPPGGLGAYIKGTFAVTPGQVLNIMVGRMGLNGTGGCGDLNGGGGGGTFVWDPTNTTNPWIAAGGGAGSGSCGASQGGPGLATLGGSGLGGTCGTANNGNGTGGGGAGWLGNGAGCRSNAGCGATAGAMTPLSGGTGGVPWMSDCFQNGAGGYGGGGAGGGNCGGAGGGGGYTGGGGGGNVLVTPGDNAIGGTSYNLGTSQTNTSGVRSGNGMVVITYTTGNVGAGNTITGPASVCAGATVNYTTTVVANATTYTWTVPTGAVINSGQGTTSINVTFGSTSGTVSYTPSGACGSGAPSNLSVTVNPLPVVALGPNVTQCGGTVLLNAGNPGSTYAWSNSATTQTITVSASGTYSVVVTTSNGCTGTGTVNVTINTLPTVSLGPNVTQCGGTVLLDAGNPGATYAWSEGSTTQTITVSTTGTYSVVVTDANGCSATDNIDVTIFTLPTVALGPNVTQCGGTVLLDAGNPGATYAWSEGSTTQTITVSTTGTYSVVVTDANGCSASGNIDITINTLPAVALGADITQCGGTALLDAGNPGSSYAWSNSATTQTVTVSASGTYSVIVTDANGCTNADTITVTINSNPAVTLTLNPTTVCLTTAAYALTGGSPSGGTYSGTGVSAGSFNPAVSGLGTFTISYIYIDPNTGCTDTATQSITVDDCSGIADNTLLGQVNIYPNPSNGQIFIAVPLAISDLTIQLSDMQGKLVYDGNAKDLQNGEVIQINTAGLSNGIYSLKLRTESGMIVKKVVIQE
jgi:hypothetical protein